MKKTVARLTARTRELELELAEKQVTCSIVVTFNRKIAFVLHCPVIIRLRAYADIAIHAGNIWKDRINIGDHISFCKDKILELEKNSLVFFPKIL